MASLQANEWHPMLIDRELLFLPDQVNAELPSERKPGTQSFSIKSGGPFAGEIAFESNLYVRMNPTYTEGDFWDFNPTGYFIVGWRNGQVTQVPVDDARLVKKRHPGTGEMVKWAVYPGMKDYSDGRPFRDLGKF
jgi:hypothetical protein